MPARASKTGELEGGVIFGESAAYLADLEVAKTERHLALFSLFGAL